MVENSYHPLSEGKAASETSFVVNLSALILSVCVLGVCLSMGMNNLVHLFTTLLVSLLVFSVGLERLLYPETSALHRLAFRRRMSWRRVAYREVALAATFGVIGFCYWLFPLFASKDFTQHYFPFLKTVVPWIAAGSLPYFCLMDRCDPEENDVYCRLGRAIVQRRCTLTRFELANYVRGWIVKAFWLGLMQPAMIEKLQWMVAGDWRKLAGTPVEWYVAATTVCFFIDLCYASVGYMTNLKMFNTQTRTAEPTLLGWAVTIVCYWPFWAVLFYPYFFRYDSAHRWLKCCTAGSAVWYVWAGAIILLELLYALATVAGGIRFSNLTYRGLWNTGPYRWTKHPAYVFKNLSWWLISVPFLLNTWQIAVKGSVLLLGLNVIYYLRARTEERHLSHYPEYVAYALAMNDRSIFRWCAKLMPFLKYRAPDESSRRFALAANESCCIQTGNMG